MKYYKPYSKRKIDDIECFYDFFRKSWRSMKYYESYKKKIELLTGVFQHDDFGNVKKIQSYNESFLIKENVVK